MKNNRYVASKSQNLEAIFADGGQKIFEHFGFEVNIPNKKQSGITIKFIKEAGKYLFKHWSKGDSGDAIAFWKLINNCPDRKTAYAEVIDFLKLDAHQQEFLKIKKNPNLEAYLDSNKPKIVAKNPNLSQKKYLIERKINFSDLELDYWYKKISWQSDRISLANFLKNQGLTSLKTVKVYTEITHQAKKILQSFQNLDGVFGFQTLKNCDDLRILQPLAEKGRGFYAIHQNKRGALPNFDQSKAIIPNYKFWLGLDTFFDISKPIYWVSGESDYLAMRAHGFQAVCLGGEGQFFNDYHREIMQKHGYGIENLTILFDKDQKGLDFAKKASTKYQIPYIILPTFEKDLKDICDIFAHIFDPKNFSAQLNYEQALKIFTEYGLKKQEREFTEGKNGKELTLRKKYLTEDSLLAQSLYSEILNNDLTFLDCGAGIGKTFFALNFFINHCKNSGIDRILFLVPTKTLAQQIEKEYQNIVCLYEGRKLKPEDDLRIVVSTYDSYQKYLEVATPQFLIVDEAHMIASESTYRKIMNDIFDLTKALPQAKTLFLTATPNHFLFKEYQEFAEQNQRKIVQIKVNALEENRIKLIDNSYKKQGEIALLRQIEQFLNLNQDNDKKMVIFSNSKKLNWKTAKLLVSLGLISNENIAYFHARKEKNTQTQVMKDIIESGKISEKIKLVFVTSIFIQGINVYNENVECIAFARNFRQTDAQIIQFLNRFRNCKEMICHMIMPKIEQSFKKFELDQAMILGKKQTAIALCQNLNQLPFSTAEKDIFYGRNEFVNTNFIYKKQSEGEIFYELSKPYIACALENAKQDSLNTADYLAEIVNNGRGISILTNEEGGDDAPENQATEVENLTNDQQNNQQDHQQTANENQAGANGAPAPIYKESKINTENLIIEKKKIKNEEKAIENEIIENCEKDFDSVICTVYQRTADQQLAKKIKENFAIEPEQEPVCEEKLQKPFFYDGLEGFLKRFLHIQSLNETLKITEIIDLLKRNRSNKEFRILLNRLSLAKMHRYRNKINMQANFRNGKIAYLNLANVILFQKVALERFAKVCEQTQFLYAHYLSKKVENKQEQERREIALKRAVLWNEKSFFWHLREDLRNGNSKFDLFKDFEDISKNDLFDLLKSVFEMEFERVDFINSDGKKQRIKLLKKLNPIFDWKV